MRNRILAVGVFFACALTLRAQQQPSLYRVELVAGATMVALGPPVIVGNNYAFSAWPDGGYTQIPQARIKRITQLVGQAADTAYRIELVPSGNIIAKDNPTLKGNTWVFHCLSRRRAHEPPGVGRQADQPGDGGRRLLDRAGTDG